MCLSDRCIQVLRYVQVLICAFPVSVLWLHEGLSPQRWSSCSLADSGTSLSVIDPLYWSLSLLTTNWTNDVMSCTCHQAAYPGVEQPPPHHPPYYHHSHPPPPPHQAYHHHHHPPLPPHEAPPPRFRDKQRAPQHRAFTSSPVSVFLMLFYREEVLLKLVFPISPYSRKNMNGSSQIIFWPHLIL